MTDFLGPIVDRHTDRIPSWGKYAALGLLIVVVLFAMPHKSQYATNPGPAQVTREFYRPNIQRNS